ncbi:hypothetical protein ACIBSW_29460 [Actinoplanes sp. NPDC049668]|uniref:hypothetical protein n=1 Tax=unclassified Actinoplanes TaxID=2626549 RepID=UPI0033AECF62
MHESGSSTPSDVQVKPGTGAARRDARDRIIGLLSVLFLGMWTVIFGVATILMVAIVAVGADNLAKTILMAAVCAAFSVFNGWRLRRPLRRLRGIRSPQAF